MAALKLIPAQDKQFAESDPRHHTRQVATMLKQIVTHLKQDEVKISEPRALAMFDTSAEVLQALITVLERYEQSSKSQAV